MRERDAAETVVKQEKAVLRADGNQVRDEFARVFFNAGKAAARKKTDVNSDSHYPKSSMGYEIRTTCEITKWIPDPGFAGGSAEASQVENDRNGRYPQSI